MNEIIINYGKLSIETFVIKLDELKLYYENKYIDITKEKIDELISTLVSFKNRDYNSNHIDNIEYDIFVSINGEENRLIGNNSSNLNKIKDWLGSVNVREIL